MLEIDIEIETPATSGLPAPGSVDHADNLKLAS